jgi:predicted RNA-binding protein with TRAM domain
VVVLLACVTVPALTGTDASAKVTAAPVVPQVSVDDAGLVQASNGDPTLTFDVTLSQPTTEAVTVDYVTTQDWQATDVPGEAIGVTSPQNTSGQFVSLPQQVLTFPKNKTEETVTVQTLPWVPSTYPQWFTVVLSNPIGATLEDAYGTGTLLPASTSPGFSVGIGDTSIREPATGSETADLTVSFSEPAPKKFTLSAATASPATADYTPTTTSVSVKAGATSALVPVTVLANPANRSSATIGVDVSTSLGTVDRRVGSLEVRGDGTAVSRPGRNGGPPRIALLGDSITSNYTDFIKPVLEAEGYAVMEDGIAGSGLLDANECQGQRATAIVATQDPDVTVFDNGGNYGFFPECYPGITQSALFAAWNAAAVKDTDILTSKGGSVYWLIGPDFPSPGYGTAAPTLFGDYLAIAADTRNVYAIDAWAPFGGATENLALRAYDDVHLNVAGDQLMTSIIVSSIPASAPSAPTSMSAVAGRAAATVSWGVPASNGSPITSYTVSAFNVSTWQWGPIVSTPGVALTSSGSVSVSGLVDGDIYLFAMTATNKMGTGPEAIDWSAVVPTDVPDAPTDVVATPGSGSASVSWTSPSPNGSPITGYTVTATDWTNPINGGQTVSGPSGPLTVPGLTDGDEYTFTVTATNANGTGAASVASAPAMPTTVPDAPTDVVATPGDQAVTVGWTNPSANGSPITGYTVTATDWTNPANGGQTVSGPSGPLTVSGLTNGDEYTFTVTATNANGTGAASQPSAGVSLSTVPDAPTEVLAAPDADDDPGVLLVYFYPGFDEGSAVSGYTVTITDQSNPDDPNNGLTVGGPAGPITVTGLTSGDTYSFTVTATNGVGTGSASLPSDGVASP